MLKQKKYQFLFLILLGGLSAFGFAPCFLWPLTALGIAILMRMLNQQQTHKISFFDGFFFGFGMGAVGMHWLTHALMVDGGRFAGLIPLVWLGFGLWFGLFWGFSALGASFFKTGWRRVLAFSGFFIIFEWVRSWLFTGFPWNPMGNIWNDYLPVMQSVSVWGIYGLSGLTVLLFASLSLGIKSRFLWLVSFCFCMTLIMGGVRLYVQPSTFVWGTHLRLVQPNIPQTLKWDPDAERENFAKLIRLSRENNSGITHILWPETAVGFWVNYDEENRLRLMSAMGQGMVLLTGGMRLVDPDKRLLANSIFVLDDLTDIHGFYDKAHLVPFGEYMPFRGWLPFEKIVPISSDIYQGEKLKTVPVLKTLPAGMLVCYEVIFSGQVVDKNRRPAWLFNATNDGWYGISFGPHQHLAMTQTRAIEEGLPLVRAANTGISAVIDPMGRIVKKLDLGQEGVVDSDLPSALSPTIYARFGVKVPLILAGLFLLFALKKKERF